MARPLRIEYPGAIYHVTSRGNAKQKIFLDDPDRSTFLGVLLKTSKRFNWICHSYCLMDNHYHLLIETTDGNLSAGMHQVNGVYAQYMNRAHERVGHVFQGRFKAIIIEKESHLLELCRYIVLNPVRAGIVKFPENYIWSSYRQTAGLFKIEETLLETDWILSQFGIDRESALREYREFVQDGIDVISPLEEVSAQLILGSEEFTQSLNEKIEESREDREITRVQRFADSAPLVNILTPERIITKQSRNTAIFEARIHYGYSQKEIAEYMGLHYVTVSRIIEQERKKRDNENVKK